MHSRVPIARAMDIQQGALQDSRRVQRRDRETDPVGDRLQTSKEAAVTVIWLAARLLPFCFIIIPSIAANDVDVESDEAS